MIELIPAIDIIGGKCVRLTQGDYNHKKVYDVDPVEVALRFEDCGIRRLHLVDLDGAAAQHVVNEHVLYQIATHTSLIIDFGGGIKSKEDLQKAFDNGAHMVTGGSIAVKAPDMFCEWLQEFGPEKIILGADVRANRIAINGWQEDSSCDFFPFLDSYIQKGVKQVICTDVTRDGMLQGPSITLYQEILQKHPDLHLIASGGVGNIHDIHFLDAIGVPSVIFGKALYEGHISLNELKSLLAS